MARLLYSPIPLILGDEANDKENDKIALRFRSEGDAAFGRRGRVDIGAEIE